MQNADILALAGLRVDGRRHDDLRRIRYKLAISASSDGSCYFEQGLNKVLVLIEGPQEPQRRGGEISNDMGSITCRILNTPFSGIERKKRRVGDRKMAEMELAIKETFESVVFLDLYPRSEIFVAVHILETDGSTICAIMNATCMALMDAGIAMRDMATACSIGFVRNQICEDVTQVEISSGGAYIPMAITARSEAVIFVQLDSRLSLDNLEEAMARAIAACRKLRVIMTAALKEHVLQLSGGGGGGGAPANTHDNDNEDAVVVKMTSDENNTQTAEGSHDTKMLE